MALVDGGAGFGGRRPARERGTAVVGTLVGFVVFLVLLLFAVQIVVRLYATSAVTSAATRAAEAVASAPGGPATGAAEANARSQLGSFGASDMTFHWEEADASRVVLRVTARSPEFLPGLPGWSRITRTVTVRTERFR